MKLSATALIGIMSLLLFDGPRPQVTDGNGPFNTEEELREMLSSLPLSFPLMSHSADGEAVIAGEISFDWFNVWRASESLDELAEEMREQAICSEVESLRAAHIIRIAKLDW